ncbi:LuxR C-terminal-related transcriptional regulator [Gordonia sp. LSe1-13]|uniref:LuxR C-terminal-related transcriptional regulator n=1 Tax=Gordonia sesuvii TaxID=3116777 RepID=A0ABU7MIV3_9ACTN|nr:LuxR C-terminal-related transcriptional regulator [Gordonia sp. LSe1-13]
MLERADQLTQINAAIGALPTGSAFSIAGESGAGKTTLVGQVCAAASDVRVLRVSCDPLDIPRPLGPIKDLGIGLTPAMLAEVCEATFAFLSTEPTVLVVEDLHWVDAATGDVLRFLCRRIESMPVVLLLTHRELDAQAPARALLAEDVARVELPPLSIAAISELVRGTGLDPIQVHAATRGNPYFATEIARDPDLPIPSTVRDAVLARTTKVTAADFEVLQLIAASPDRVADTALPALHVDFPTVRRLMTTGLLEWGPGGVLFRHEIARRAVESTIPPGGVRHLHARLLDALEQLDGVDASVLTHHAVAARDSDRAFRHARAAAEDAVRGGAHTEAVAFYEIALEHQRSASTRERAELLLALANEQYMVSRLPEAIATVNASFPLWTELDDASGLATAHTAVGVYEYYSAQRRRAETHLTRASQIAHEKGALAEYGHAQVQLAFLAFMRGDEAHTQDRLAESITAPGELMRLWNLVVADAAALARGDNAARTRLFAHMESARAYGFDELASTVYSQVASLDVEQGRYRAAVGVLDVGLPFTVERDIQICRHWQTAVRSRLHLTRGHWSGALEDADAVIDANGMPIATLWPHLVKALVPLRCGAAFDDAEVEDAWALSEQIDEPLRRLAVLTALAEISWMTGHADRRVLDADTLDGDGAEWGAGGLAVWRRRLGLATATGVIAEPYRLSLDGRHADAAQWWYDAGDPFSAAMSWLDSDEPARGVTILDGLGALGTADRARAMLRERGGTDLPQRPRRATRANPGGLTNRQLEVARLVAEGLSNAEIATRLYISPKTADHHVSAVLTKLGLSSRREVLAQGAELGLR